MTRPLKSKPTARDGDVVAGVAWERISKVGFVPGACGSEKESAPVRQHCPVRGTPALLILTLQDVPVRMVLA